MKSFGALCLKAEKTLCERGKAIGKEFIRIGIESPFIRIELKVTARRSCQSILKEINPEYSLEGLMLKKLQYFGHLM